jgi:hypothetical protein
MPRIPTPNWHAPKPLSRAQKLRGWVHLLHGVALGLVLLLGAGKWVSYHLQKPGPDMEQVDRERDSAASMEIARALLQGPPRLQEAWERQERRMQALERERHLWSTLLDFGNLVVICLTACVCLVAKLCQDMAKNAEALEAGPKDKPARLLRPAGCESESGSD